MIVSHWDRTVAPYAKWIGFSAGMFEVKILMKGLINLKNFRIVSIVIDEVLY